MRGARRGSAREVGMRKKWLVLAAGALVVLVAAFLAVRLALPPQRLRVLVAAQIQAGLGHPVQIGAIRVAWMPLAIRADDVVVAAPDGFAAAVLLRVGALELRPRL